MTSRIPDDMLNSVIVADWTEACQRLPDGCIDLVVTDPPYELPDMGPCFDEIKRVLRSHGTLYCFGDKNVVAERWFAQAQGFHAKELLVWHYRNSPKPRGRWRLSMQAVIYATTGPDAVFNEDEVRVQYTEAAKRLHGRKRPSRGRMPQTVPYDMSKGALPRDVIDSPALLGHLARERVGHPDQKPIELIDKLIRASSNKGDMVLDMFAGSGTTLVAAKRLSRKYVGVEISLEYARMAEVRLGIV